MIVGNRFVILLFCITLLTLVLPGMISSTRRHLTPCAFTIFTFCIIVHIPPYTLCCQTTIRIVPAPLICFPIVHGQSGQQPGQGFEGGTSSRRNRLSSLLYHQTRGDSLHSHPLHIESLSYAEDDLFRQLFDTYQKNSVAKLEEGGPVQVQVSFSLIQLNHLVSI